MPSSVNPTTSDPYMTSVQWSRRFIGLKLFLSLAERGEDGQAKMIEHQARMGDLLRESLTAAGWRVVNRTPLPVVCFMRDGLDVPAFLQELRREQAAWMSETCLAGTSVVRACITSFKTTAEDIFDVVRKITDLADKIGAPVETAPCEMN
jgi:glutamate/tyrosine decarboxylase-like PLP-dependent enzyme